MSTLHDEECEEEFIIRDKNSLYFDKRHKKEESPFEIPEEQQRKCELLESCFESICPQASLDESIVNLILINFNKIKKASRKEREKLGIEDDDNFVYGEITFRSFAYIFEVIKSEFGGAAIDKGNFVDLGSVGSGKGCIAAAMLHPFKKCIGYEIFDDLHSLALKTKIHYDINFHKFLTNPELYKSNSKTLFANYAQKPDLLFYKKNFLLEKWTNNASVVFTNSTCFDLRTWEGIAQQSQKLKKGAIFLNTTKNMPKEFSKNWISLPSFQRLMSWGVCTIFIHKKRF